jgi:hypothetical protein
VCNESTGGPLLPSFVVGFAAVAPEEFRLSVRFMSASGFLDSHHSQRSCT